ncbi:bifunctional metallophosphatase/5'-nucleotidase [Lactobacillus xylocopicola]|uniref:Multifunctional 2',3'-cyclic-nucleotide 2'-phosphodiesterase/5'-nucleotidase/3'-nucleotidase n=1 Tax=Lactobacillus xylocopicola TaxID=2976676 RepID=A0ABM8BFS7_9LACO|nr:bifunctional UDP-sugar hydrolase/5'-nucleotidase [Lactobacillus xylocopicola]BDR60099.1 multifunctional 2',3'-cyclic-nucleotide 2'-phosphodiesterase/5'-nucleotidase/3'-nucleotidase [Lactobacillus xylocopicola]
MEKIRILHTNDLHSHFEHFLKIGRYLHEAQQDQTVDEVLTFDAGDFMDRSHPLTDATFGQANIKLMNAFHYDAITIGNNEGISNSHEVVEHLFDHAQFPVVLANLREEDGSMPHWATTQKIIKTKKGTRIALIGLTAAYPLSYQPNHWQVKMLKETMDEVLPELAGHYDVLILLTHVGLNMDCFLAQNYPQINLIVGGHSHDLLKQGKQVNGVWIVQTGKWGNYVGNTYLQLNDNHQVERISPHVEPTSLMKAQTGDEETILGFRKCGKEILTRTKVANLPEKYEDNCEAAIQVSLDAIAAFAGTDLAMLSSGLFLTPFKKGVLTKYDLQRALPHSMHVVRSTLQGSDLWRLVMEIEKNRHYLDHFHLQGMSFRGKIFGQMYYRQIKFDPVSRVVFVNGKEVDPQQEYQIAVLDHYVLVPFFPTLAIVGNNKFLFPQFLREVVGNYLAQKYPYQGSENHDGKPSAN